MVIPARSTPVVSRLLPGQLITCLVFLFLITTLPAIARPIRHPPPHPILSPTPGPTFSTKEQALAYIATITFPDSSTHWPRVRTHLFLENLKANITNPLILYQGSNTNFCGYAALAYIPLHNDPLGYTRFLVELFLHGNTTWNGISFTPSDAVRRAAGTLLFKGILDIRPADQMWFLVLADHFKAYLNFFFPHFHTGSEDTFWAACNYGKFNRIIRQLFKYQVEARGSDLIRPCIHDIYQYLEERIHTGTTYLYVNNTYLSRKNHNKGKAPFPTHYLVLTDIWKTDDLLTIVYWDYGVRSLRQISPAFLKKITFGVTHCPIPGHDQ